MRNVLGAVVLISVVIMSIGGVAAFSECMAGPPGPPVGDYYNGANPLTATERLHCYKNEATEEYWMEWQVKLVGRWITQHEAMMTEWSEEAECGVYSWLDGEEIVDTPVWYETEPPEALYIQNGPYGTEIWTP